MTVQRDAKLPSRQAVENAVHMIASVEPALDTAIERFAKEDQDELLLTPARQTILSELCEMISRVAHADSHVASAEINSYSELLEAFDVGKRPTAEIVSELGACSRDGRGSSF